VDSRSCEGCRRIVLADWLEEDDAIDVEDEDNEWRLGRLDGFRGEEGEFARGAATGMMILDFLSPERENAGAAGPGRARGDVARLVPGEEGGGSAPAHSPGSVEAGRESLPIPGLRF